MSGRKHEIDRDRANESTQQQIVLSIKLTFGLNRPNEFIDCVCMYRNLSFSASSTHKSPQEIVNKFASRYSRRKNEGKKKRERDTRGRNAK